MAEDFDDGGGVPEDYGMTQADFDSASAIGAETYSGSDDQGMASLYTQNQPGNMFQNKNVYTAIRGASSTNPFPESFFSQLFGADNVNYTNILGSDRINEINDLRYNQATGGMSNRTGANTGKPYQMGDYYVGQPTQMGTVREVPQTGIMSIMDNLPGIGPISKVLGRNRGLPEELIEPYMEEQNKSANEPGIFSGIMNTGKNVLDDISTGAKDLFTGIFPPPPPSPVVSPVENVKIENLSNFSDRRGQFGVPDTRNFDAFGNVTGSDLDTEDRFKTIEQLAKERKKLNELYYGGSDNRTDFQNNPKVQQNADLSQTFRNMGDEMNQFIGADGKKIGEGNLRFTPDINNKNLQLQYQLPISKYLDRAFG